MIATYHKLIEREIRKLRFGKQPAALYEPIRYLMQLGGKRLRPLLVLLAYSLFKNNVKNIIRYAVAVEAFHNFTLMHDDIMDNAPLRRGKPTVHEKWNVNTAILSGDVMLVHVYNLFLALPPEKLNPVLTIFNRCAAEVCEGQQWDMEFETMKAVTEKQYIEMIRQKTAVLLGFSLELGGVLAEATPANCKALRDFGTNIGIGFQLMDDLLDAYARDPAGGGYALADSFRLDPPRACDDNVAIDVGPLILAIENARTGMVWRLFHQHGVARRATQRLGFRRARGELKGAEASR